MSGQCWTWSGATAGAGYGTIYLSGIGVRYVHRIVYELVHGSIPRGLEIDHLCRNKLCFNPAHLEAVTHAENRRRARVERCVRGHSLEGGRERPGHGRVCRKCDAIRAAKYRARMANAA